MPAPATRKHRGHLDLVTNEILWGLAGEASDVTLRRSAAGEITVETKLNVVGEIRSSGVSILASSPTFGIAVGSVGTGAWSQMLTVGNQKEDVHAQAYFGAVGVTTAVTYAFIGVGSGSTQANPDAAILAQFRFHTTDFRPANDNTYDLGTSIVRWRAIHGVSGMITGALVLGTGEIVASTAKLQVNGLMRTGTIYLHPGDAPPDPTRQQDALVNSGGDLYWKKGGSDYKLWHAGNDGDGSLVDADLLDGQHGGYYLAATNLTGTLPEARLPVFSGDVSSSVGSASLSVLRTRTGGQYQDATVVPTHEITASYLRVFDAASGTGYPVSGFPVGIFVVRYSGGGVARGSFELFSSVNDADPTDFYLRKTKDLAPSVVWGPTCKIWHDQNDGDASGLDADLLDGQQGSYYLNTSTTEQNKSGILSIGATGTGQIKLTSGTASPDRPGYVAFHTYDAGAYTRRGYIGFSDDGTNMMLFSQGGWRWRFNDTPYVGTDLIWHAGNDGATTGLDADLLDAQHGAYYLDAGNLTGTINIARLPSGINADLLDGLDSTYFINTSTGDQTKAGALAVTKRLAVGGMATFDGSGSGTSMNPSRIFTALNTLSGISGTTDTVSAWSYMQGLVFGSGYHEGGQGPLPGAFMANLLAFWDARGGTINTVLDGTTISSAAWCSPPTTVWKAGRRSYTAITNSSGVDKNPSIEFVDPTATASSTTSMVYGSTTFAAFAPYLVLRSTIAPSNVKVEIKAGATEAGSSYVTVFDGAPVVIKGVWRGPVFRLASGAHAMFGLKFTFTCPHHASTYEFLEVGLCSNWQIPGAYIYASPFREQTWTQAQTFSAALNAGTISASGNIVAGTLTFPLSTGAKISLYDNRLGLSTMYGLGIEGGALYYVGGSHRWYVNAVADGGTSAKLELTSSTLSTSGVMKVSPGSTPSSMLQVGPNFIATSVSWINQGLRLGNSLFIHNQTTQSKFHTLASDNGGYLVITGSGGQSSILSASQLACTVADSTSPLIVTSTTLVTNLNADRLDDLHASAFALAGHDHNGVYEPVFTKGNLVQGSGVTLSGTLTGRLVGSGDVTITSTGTGVTDHGALSGREDDDHLQYHTDARGDARYSLLAHHTFASLTSKPTTIAGYGITDAYTKTEGDARYSAIAHHTFASLTSKPTTIAGYAITDAYTKTESDALYALTARGLPAGGAAQSVLMKSSSGDYVVGWGTVQFAQLGATPTSLSGYGITDAYTKTEGDARYALTARGLPSGGTTGQVLAKSSGTDYAVGWVAAGSGGVTDHGALSGREDDDHSQYHTDTRGDARYLKLTGGTCVGEISFGSWTRQMLDLYPPWYGIGVQASTTYIRTFARFSVFAGGSHDDDENDPGAGTELFTVKNDGTAKVLGYPIWHTGNLTPANYEPVFTKGSLVAGTGISLSGTLSDRLVGSGNVTITATAATVPFATVTFTSTGAVGAQTSVGGDASGVNCVTFSEYHFTLNSSQPAGNYKRALISCKTLGTTDLSSYRAGVIGGTTGTDLRIYVENAGNTSRFPNGYLVKVLFFND